MLKTFADLRVLRGLALLVMVLAMVALYFEPRFSICMFYNLTGLPCPGCGFTRSLAALLVLDIQRSLYLHPFGLPGAFALLLLFLPDRWLLRHGSWLGQLYLLGALLLIIFGVLRGAALFIDARYFSGWFYPFKDPGLRFFIESLLSG